MLYAYVLEQCSADYEGIPAEWGEFFGLMEIDPGTVKDHIDICDDPAWDESKIRVGFELSTEGFRAAYSHARRLAREWGHEGVEIEGGMSFGVNEFFQEPRRAA